MGEFPSSGAEVIDRNERIREENYRNQIAERIKAQRKKQTPAEKRRKEKLQEERDERRKNHGP